MASYLITHSEKEELIKQMHFSPENLWLKDYYISRIRSDVRQSSEYEGVVKRMRIDGEQSSHLCAPSDHDESGMTPPRFQTEVLNDDDVHLRRVVSNQASDVQKPRKNMAASIIGSHRNPTPNAM